MTTDLVLFTYDRVPPPPRGYVRDIRVRWALEEAGLDYRVEAVPFDDRSDARYSHQPFGQVPWLTDGDLSIFESGAILLHLGERSEILMPREPGARAAVITWLFAALNSVEMASLHWSLFKFSGDQGDTPAWHRTDAFLQKRLTRLEAQLAQRIWLADAFSIADIMMADVLRLIDRFDGLAAYPHCRAYVGRATQRPAFQKAYRDQMAHFAEAE